MNALLVLALAVQDSKSFLPLEDGAERTFLETRNRESKEIKLKMSGLKDFRAKLVRGKPGMDVEFREPAEKGLMGLFRGEEIWIVLETTEREIIAYERAMEGHFVESFCIPKDLSDMQRWDGFRVFLSCGFGSSDVRFEALGEKIELSGRVVYTIKVIGKCEGRAELTLWLQRGVGLVKWSGLGGDAILK